MLAIYFAALDACVCVCVVRAKGSPLTPRVSVKKCVRTCPCALRSGRVRVIRAILGRHALMCESARSRYM